MKRLLAICLSGTIALTFWMTYTPEEVTAFAAQTSQHESARTMNYAQYDKRPVTGETYREVLARTPRNVINLYYMGSSDVVYGELGNPGKFIPKYLPGFDMYMSGRPHAQSLYHAIELAAIAPVLRERKVVYHISPQHFTQDSPDPRAFQTVFSWLLWFEMWHNQELSEATKTRILQRAVQLYPGLCQQYLYCESPSWSDTLAKVKSVGHNSSIRMSAIGELYREMLFTNTYDAPYSGPDVAPRPVPESFWNDRVAEFRSFSKEQSHNPMTVPDRNWRGNVEDKTRQYRNQQQQLSYGSSAEYHDLALFLAVAKELNIEVLIAMTPPSAKWLKITGMPRAGVESYYRNIRELIAQYPTAHLADFSALENEDYYFEDQSHLWMTAWVRLIQAAYNFAVPPK